MRLAPAALLLLAACGPSESTVREEIEQARACTADAQCVDAGSVCPFGCSITVNASEAGRIRSLLADFQSNCDYRCLSTEKLVCEKGLCTAAFAE